MSEPLTDRLLIDLWRAGDLEAARPLVDSYVDRLLAVARQYISQRLAGRVDPEDVVQSVFRTFFRRLRTGRFRLEHPEDVQRLLVRITVLKALQQVRRNLAGKRSARREEGQENGGRLLRELLDREPTPEAAAAFVDQLQHFLGRLRPEERRILRWRMEGYTVEEIALNLGTYDRKVRRFLERIRGLAEQEDFDLHRSLTVSCPASP